MKATGGKREEACGATEAFPYCVPGDVTGPGLSGTDLTGATYISDYQLRPVNMPELAKALLAHGANPNGRIKKRYTRGPFGSPINMAGATPFEWQVPDRLYDRRYPGAALAGSRTDRIVPLKALTSWGAYYLMKEKTMGSLEPGKLADFMILDKDFLTVPEQEIPGIQALMTAVGGKVVHLTPALASEFAMQPAGPTTWKEPIPDGWQ
jgi:hypothetical protein